ncbi:MAG: hypothetical protein KGL39_17810 [Patescibacteria group bacterium]|nr:hypothetical protein [Patescibacteria group bacterium]
MEPDDRLTDNEWEMLEDWADRNPVMARHIVFSCDSRLEIDEKGKLSIILKFER